jgi:dienelactone hydrolase
MEKNMHTAEVIYRHDDLPLHGFIAHEEGASQIKRPAVLIVHDWSGRNESACEKAKQFATLGYIGFAVDMYGRGRIGVSNDEKMALMTPLVNDRKLLAARIRAAFETVQNRPEVDATRIAVLGFCFGGMCALDLARSGVSLKAAVSCHGLLAKPDKLDGKPIQAKILALHGYADPMVDPEQLLAFCQEMEAAKVDWQVHCYGQVQHAFTNPNAHDEELGLVYNPLAATRAWLAIEGFLEEVL